MIALPRYFANHLLSNSHVDDEWNVSQLAILILIIDSLFVYKVKYKLFYLKFHVVKIFDNH